MTDHPETPGRDHSERARLWPALLALQLVLLAAEFLAGTATNLYAGIPAAHPGSVHAGGDYFTDLGRAETWVITGGPAVLRVHAVLGLLIGAVAVALVIAAVRAGGRGRAVAAWTGLLTIIGAGFNGGSFLIFGDGDNLASFLMAGLFLVAAAAYAIALGGALRRPGAPGPDDLDWPPQEPAAEAAAGPAGEEPGAG